jgi:predicted nucleic acid-binding protein
MSNKILIDTNLWVYLYAKSPESKYHKVKQTVDENFNTIILSTQVLGELYYILTTKSFCTQEEAKEIIIETITVFPIIEIDALNVLKAIDINERYKYSYWDSLLIATALINSCQVLYSEDMQHNQLIENKLRIVNPLIESKVEKNNLKK